MIGRDRCVAGQSDIMPKVDHYVNYINLSFQNREMGVNRSVIRSNTGDYVMCCNRPIIRQ